jgi:hypothetical protein
MTEAEIAKDYVLKHLKSNKEFRLRLSELFLGKCTDVDAEYLLTAMRVEWPNMGDAEQLQLAQAVAGARHYNAFIQVMTT